MQDLIEDSWRQGLDPDGAKHYGNILKGKRGGEAWTGPQDFKTLLKGLGIKSSVKFYRDDEENAEKEAVGAEAAEAVEGSCMAAKDGESEKGVRKSAADSCFEECINYFERAAENSAEAGTQQCIFDMRNRTLDVPPILLQYPSHSVVVVGLETDASLKKRSGSR